MNLPSLIQRLYGVTTFTGLYSFEFVDKNRDTITEIFLMVPPKTKTVSEPTRSSTVATLGGNYNIDGGNATKMMTIAGELYFPYVGSPDNPVAQNNEGLENTLTGYEEFIKLQWALLRYRDYTLTPDAKITIPSTLLAVSPEINTLYKKVSKKINDKSGALYDEIKLIVHDYDMDDHFYCRIDKFESSQSANKHIAIDYTIDIECYSPDDKQKNKNQSNQTKISAEAGANIVASQLDDINFAASLDSIQGEIGYNADFLSSAQTIENIIDDIIEENENIQAGKTTPSTNLPKYVSEALTSIGFCMTAFITTFLSSEQKTLYDSGDQTIESLVSGELLSFYNSLQKTKFQIQSMDGILKSIPKLDELRYYANSNDYTLTEEQFDNDDTSKVANNPSFYYYTVLQNDTARIIALRELGDQEKFIQILKINNISENNFIDEELVGQKIKIPMPLSALSNGNDNLVYESDYEDSEKFLFGSDIFTTENKKMKISETGDILATIGIDNVFQNVETRVITPKGSLNVFQPDFGVISIGDGNALPIVKIERYLTDVLSQIQADPRVESVQMDLDKLEWKGETISVPTKIFFIGTEETREVSV